MHTPYNRRINASSGAATVEKYPGYAIQLVKYGYVVAVVDFRGLYASYGQNRGYNRGGNHGPDQRNRCQDRNNGNQWCR